MKINMTILKVLLSILLFHIPYNRASSQETPAALAELWIAAIHENSVDRMLRLVHPECPGDLVPQRILERMVSGSLPPKYVVETRDLGPGLLLERVYQVVPDKQLNITFVTETPAEKEKYGLGKGFPIAQHDGRWFFTICLRADP